MRASLGGGSLTAVSRLWSTVAAAGAHGLSCSVARGIFLEQGPNPCPPPWQVDSYNHTIRGVLPCSFLN